MKIEIDDGLLPDPVRLEIIAEWVEMVTKSVDGHTEVQDDLRKWAKNIREAQEKNLSKN